MKNKVLFFFLILLLNQSLVFSEEQLYIFESSNIKIDQENEYIIAKNGKASSLDNNFQINADELKYSKKSKILEINGNSFIFIKKNNLEIFFDKGILDKNNSLFKAIGKIKINDKNQKLIFETDSIFFDYKKNFLTSPKNSTIYDRNNNVFLLDNFEYEINNSLIKAKNLNLIDKDNNKLTTEIVFIDTMNNNFYGKDVSLKLQNISQNKENEPRFKARTFVHKKNVTDFNKAVFTTCKKRNEECPPWEISASKIQHDKINKIINYENAVLRLYNTPIIYFPKFYHPDPSVKRKSGLLVPSLKSFKNGDNYLSLPYFQVISDNKDITFTPRFYDQDKFLLQSEVREVLKNSNHISDFSIKFENDQKLKSHFFYKYDKNLNLDNFDENKLGFKIQQTSKDTYLRKNNIKTDLEFNDNVLENSFEIDLSSSDFDAEFKTVIYENLFKEENDRYEYIFPNINLFKRFNNFNLLDGDFSLNSKLFAKNYETNIYETVSINDLIFKSSPIITNKGFNNDYEMIIKNLNSNAKNSKRYKNKDTIYASSLIQLNSSLPLIKETNYYKNILNPKFSLKIAPKHTKNIRNIENKIDVDNVYNLNRLNNNDEMIEGGLSLTYGSEFTMTNKKNLIDFFKFKIANNLRLEENNNLPGDNQLNKKVSSIFNKISYQPNNLFKLEYDSSIKNNLSDINYERFITEFKINNLITSFNYVNENNTNEKNSYLINKTKFNIDKNKAISFSTSKNKTLNLTEYYNLAYQYENDCLLASIEYNKNFYNDRDIKPTENFLFKLTIIPFEKTNKSISNNE
jgi:LPS-assembly protein